MVRVSDASQDKERQGPPYPLPRRALGLGQTPRCERHPEVRMVLASTNPGWNTALYLCPLCAAAGEPPLELALGIVSAYWPERQYGFIHTGGPAICFDASQWQGDSLPRTGQRVWCRVQLSTRGLVGQGVRRA